MFVSLTYGILSPAERVVRWVRAGHNPTLRVTIDGKVSEIQPSGMVLGMKAGQGFRDTLEVESTQVAPGDLFLLYTDGITEATNAQGEEFGIERLGEVLALCRRGSPDPEKLVVEVMDRVRHFRGSTPIADDFTLLALAVE
jgi:sigma-B regulation protein RsbU (phosphoserine phosphatase)